MKMGNNQEANICGLEPYPNKPNACKWRGRAIQIEGGVKPHLLVSETSVGLQKLQTNVWHHYHSSSLTQNITIW